VYAVDVRLLRTLQAFSVVAVVASCTRSGHAEATDRCAADAEAAQQLRTSGTLLAAKQHLVACANLTCPARVRAECVTWLREVDASLPTVVFAAREKDGRDVTDVRVSVDGTPLLENLDGKPVPLDPGSHRFRFERTDGAAVAVPAVLATGEKDRLLLASFPAKPSPSLEVGSPKTQDSPKTPQESPVPWVLGGVSATALLAFVILDTFAAVRYASFDSCSPRCDAADVSAARAVGTVGDVSLGVALVAGGLLAWRLLSRPHPSSSARSTFGSPHEPY
jgi:hypothetical protein